MNSDHQDWTTVTLRNPKRALENAQKRIVPVAAAGVPRRILEEDIPKPRYLTREARQALMAARVANKLSQRDTDARCAFPANTIRDLEAGTLAPNPQHLRSLQRNFPAVRFTVEH
jgi:ribosome-binding protein aMBF1 (putative translation factor)